MKTTSALLAAALAAFSAHALSLDGEWRLDYFPQPDDGAVRSLPIPAGLDVRSVPASVPGNCELDLVNAGILPLVFENSDDADRIFVGDMLKLPSVGGEIAEGRLVTLELPDGDRIMLRTKLSERQKKILLAGGLLRYTEQSLG